MAVAQVTAFTLAQASQVNGIHNALDAKALGKESPLVPNGLTVVAHSLGFKPIVQVINSSGGVEPIAPGAAVVIHIDNNNFSYDTTALAPDTYAAIFK